jgi:glyoxylase-like metal-dependent hydrolase (beta-lactamase superfamily II)
MNERILAPLSRRRWLAGASTVAVGAALGGTIGLGAKPALAKLPMIEGGTPYFYRFNLGGAQATIVSDGVLPLGDPSGAFIGLSPDEVRAQLSGDFLRTDNIILEQNILVLNTGDRVVLFDTGMGTSKLFGPTTGQMMNTLAQAGIDPKGVDAVVMSHAHIDHCGGIMADDGTNHFPNAQLFITQSDFDYWTNEQTVGPKLRAFYDQAKKNLTPNKDRIHFIKDGEEILPGIHALAAPGHTVGHTIFMIDQGGKQLCYMGDLTHHQILLLQKPLTEFAYDTDPKQSAQSRVKMLTMLANNKIPVLAYHLPWPGIGHIAKAGDGFRYVPEPMQLGAQPA